MLQLVRESIQRELNRRKEARFSLIEFTRYTKQDYTPALMHRMIADALEAVERGDVKRLMIETPPRHGKSELVSRRFPAYYLGKHPEHQFISASYGAELATGFGREVRNLMASPRFHVLFPDVSLAEDSQAKNRWHTNKGGAYLAAGVGSAITGHGAHVFNIDDPVKDRAEAESQVFRDGVWDWYRAVAYTRLMPGAAVVLTMTRWHEDDLAGRILQLEKQGGEKWEKVHLPAFNADHTALWPEAYSVEDLDRIRSTIGERDWFSLYEQEPRPIEGSFFTLSDLLVNERPIAFPSFCDGVFATVDSATKTGKDNDGTAVCYWARSAHVGHPLVLLDWDIAQIEGALLETWLPGIFTNLETFARDTHARMGVLGTWIEDKASGMILLQQAQRRGLAVNAIDSKLTSVGKTERAINVSGYVFRKMVKIADRAYDRVKVYKGASKNHLLSQLLGFHVGTKDMGDDDLLDAFTYGVAIGLGNQDGF